MMTPRSPRELLSLARRARGRRLPAAVAVVVASVALATAATVPIGAGAAAAEDAAVAAPSRASSLAWSPFFAHERPVNAIDGRRVIVSFDDPSLGEWSSAGARTLGAKQRTAWLRKARAAQQDRLDALALAGVNFTVEHRYLRVLNGASLLVHGDGAQLLNQMEGVTHVVPVRTVWPAAVTNGAPADVDGVAGAAAVAGAPRRVAKASGSGSGSVVVAVLDSAIDTTHPAFAGHIGASYSTLGAKQPAAADAHGTAVASAMLRGAGPQVEVEVMPVEVFGQRPTRDGIDAVFGESDDLLAGLERAVDPDRSVATNDGADVAVIAASTPFAGFTNSVEERAVTAATALGTLVVAAAGNDGASGDAVGTIGSVAAATDALAVGAVDLRGEVPVADVRVRGGRIDETLANAPILTTGNARIPGGDLAIVAIDGIGDEVVDYLDAELRSRVTGAVALVTAREQVLVATQVRAAADAGAIAVLVATDEAAAAAATIDVPGADVPAIGLAREDAFALNGALRDGERLALTMTASTERNGAHGQVAGFSSTGPRFDGVGRPDLLAPGVGMLVAAPGGGWSTSTGTSIAAAWAAGQAAAVRAAQPDWNADDVRAALVGSATPLGSNRKRPAVSVQGAGVADAGAAARATVHAGVAGRIDFGSIAPGTSGRVQLELRDTDGEPVSLDGVRIQLDDGGHAAPTPMLADGELVLDVPAEAASGPVGGWLVLDAHSLRIPWSAMVRDAAAATSPIRATVSSRILERVSGPGAYASTLQLAVGGDSGSSGTLGLGAVQQLEVRLVDAKGTDHGVVGSLEHALPGVYTFGLTGVDADGDRLKRGAWQLHVRYVPAADPTGEWRTGPITTIAVRAPKRAAADK